MIEFDDTKLTTIERAAVEAKIAKRDEYKNLPAGERPSVKDYLAAEFNASLRAIVDEYVADRRDSAVPLLMELLNKSSERQEWLKRQLYADESTLPGAQAVAPPSTGGSDTESK